MAATLRRLLEKLRCILFYLFQFVNCWQIFSGAEFWKTDSKFRNGERKSFLVFTSFTKRENRHFHVVVVQWRQKKNVQKSVLHLQSSCFVNLNLFLFFRSHWVCRRLCLSSHILVRGDRPCRKEKSIISQNVSFRSFCSQTLCMLVIVCSCCCCLQ